MKKLEREGTGWFDDNTRDSYGRKLKDEGGYTGRDHSRAISYSGSLDGPHDYGIKTIEDITNQRMAKNQEILN